MRSSRRVDVSNLRQASGHAVVLRAATPLAGRHRYRQRPPEHAGCGPPPPVQTTSERRSRGRSGDGVRRAWRRQRPATDGEPPDPWVAVGPEHVFQAVNTTFRISDRSGTALQTVDMFDFFGLGEFPNGTVAYFDPRVIYDSLHARWVAIQVSFDCFANAPSTIGTGYLDIADFRRAGSDGRLELSARSPFRMSSLIIPGLGTSTDKVVVSANLFALASRRITHRLRLDRRIHRNRDGGRGLVRADRDRLRLPRSFGTPRTSTSRGGRALQTPATSATVFAIARLNTMSVAYARITGSPAGGGVTTIAYDDLTSDSTVIARSTSHPNRFSPARTTIDDARRLSSDRRGLEGQQARVRVDLSVRSGWRRRRDARLRSGQRALHGVAGVADLAPGLPHRGGREPICTWAASAMP